MSSSKGPGFTFVEIMVAVVIMSIIFIPMIHFFTRSQQQFQKGAQTQDSLLSAAILMRQIKRDMRASAASLDPDGKLKITIDPTDGTVDKMSIPVYSGSRAKDSQTGTNCIPLLGRVTYEYKPDFSSKLGKKGDVIRVYTPHPADTVNKPLTHVIAKNIVSFKVFEYKVIDREYFRIEITGFSSNEAIGPESAVQLFTSVGSRYFASMANDKEWMTVEKNRPKMK